MSQNKSYMSVIGQNIKKLRAGNKTSQAQLAQFLGIQTQTVSKWEREVCAPDIEKIPEIAAFFGVNIDELFRTGSEKSPEVALSQLKKLMAELKFQDLCEKVFEFAIAFPQNKEFTEYLLEGAVQSLHCKLPISQSTLEQAVNIGKRTAAEHADAYGIIYNLCALLYLLKRNKEADFYYDMLCPATLCRQMLSHYTYTGEARKKALKENIGMYHTFIATSLSLLADKEKELSNIVKYRDQAIFHHEQAFAYTGNKRFLEINLSLMLAIRTAFAESGESEKAAEVLAQAERYAQKYGLQDCFAKLCVRHVSEESGN